MIVSLISNYGKHRSRWLLTQLERWVADLVSVFAVNGVCAGGLFACSPIRCARVVVFAGGLFALFFAVSGGVRCARGVFAVRGRRLRGVSVNGGCARGCVRSLVNGGL